MADVSTSELLQFAVDNGILDLELVQDKINMQKKEEVLKKHPYKIYLGADGRWTTYLPDDTKGRKLIKKSTEDAIKNEVYQYWKDKVDNPTVKELFDIWLGDKLRRDEITKATKSRYERQFQQSCLKFGSNKISDITDDTVIEFIYDVLGTHVLTPKAFSNLKTIIKGVFKFAKRKKYINFSISQTLDDLDVPKNSFKHITKTDDQEVFMDDEMDRVKAFLNDNKDIINLGIELMFATGLRVGELVAIEKSDINGNVINITKTETFYTENGCRIYDIEDRTKTIAGTRQIIIPTKYLTIITEICKINPFGKYLFEQNGERIKTNAFRDRMKVLCRATKITSKSPHKIRKRYATILIDSNVPESLIIKQMGHTNIKTTKGFYYKNKNTDAERLNIIDSVSSL